MAETKEKKTPDYYPLTDVDEGFPLVAETNLKTLRVLRSLQVRTPAIGAKTRQDICTIMGWNVKAAVKDDLPEPDFWRETGYILFGGAFRKIAEKDDGSINYKEVARAKQDFLA